MIFRYQSIRRTITSRQFDINDEPTTSSEAPGSPNPGAAPPPPPPDPPSSSSDTREPRQPHPAVTLLCRPDFYSILHMDQVN